MANNDQVGGTLSTAMAHDGASALTPPSNGDNRNEKTVSSDDAEGHTQKETAIPVRTQGSDDNIGKRPAPGSGVVEGSGAGAGGGGNTEDPDAGHVGQPRKSSLKQNWALVPAKRQEVSETK